MFGCSFQVIDQEFYLIKCHPESQVLAAATGLHYPGAITAEIWVFIIKYGTNREHFRNATTWQGEKEDMVLYSSTILELIGQTQVQHVCVGKIPERILKAITIEGTWKEEK